MPLFEFLCTKCDAVTEFLTLGHRSEKDAPACVRCGSAATVKLVSRVSFKRAKRAKYSEDFLHRARPFLQSQRETAEFFDAGKGSDDAKTFALAERIGERIDRTLASRLPVRKR